jgi:uncharacterized Ntn-hydrolase superfamily protein
VASQNVTDPALGPRLLDLLEGGLGAGAALAKITAETPDIGWRQLLVVDRNGDCALFTGDRALGVPGEARADGVVAGGNLLADPGVPAAMVAAYLAARGPFGDRLLAGLTGGLAAGGEAGPVHSAGMKIADRLSWPLVDLRVDWAEEDPVSRLREGSLSGRTQKRFGALANPRTKEHLWLIYRTLKNMQTSSARTACMLARLTGSKATASN